MAPKCGIGWCDAFWTAIYGENSSKVAIARAILAVTLTDRDNDAALVLYRQAAAALRLIADNTQDTSLIEHNVGSVLMELGRFEEAIWYLRRAREIGQKVFAPENGTLAFFRRQLAWALYATGHDNEAERELRQALPVFEQRKSTANLLYVQADLACIAIRKGGEGIAQARSDLAAALERFDLRIVSKQHTAMLRRCLSGERLR